MKGTEQLLDFIDGGGLPEMTDGEVIELFSQFLAAALAAAPCAESFEFSIEDGADTIHLRGWTERK